MKTLQLTGLVFTMCCANLLAQATGPDWRADGRLSLTNGGAYLIAIQYEDGSWGDGPKTAITALCVAALTQCPIEDDHKLPAIDKGMAFVLQHVKPDGSIRATPERHYVFFSDDGYPTYTTACALLAMAAVHKPEYEPMMRSARAFLKTVQVATEGEADYGGFGYKPGSRADMSNTAWAVEALHATDYLDEEPNTKDPKDAESTKLMWQRLDSFLAKCANRSDLNSMPDVRYDDGFGYRPGMVSSGSMSYAGLKSMIYAEVGPQDPRVVAVMRYVAAHYTVTENPGQGQRGYYYYLQTMSKALHAAGIQTLATGDGKSHNWREELVEQVAHAQQATGRWVNADGRYMENIPELVTAYTMLSLSQALAPPAPGP